MRLTRQQAAGLVALAAIIIGIVGCAPGSAGSASPILDWWLTGSTVKVTADMRAPVDSTQTLYLHAARQEYAPFQVVFRAGNEAVGPVALIATLPPEYFTLTLYHQHFLALPIIPKPEIFSLSRLQAEALPDGLRPFDGSVVLAAGETAAIWADLYVHPGTPPGDYSLTLDAGEHGAREVVITVYPVDLDPVPSVGVLIPLEAEWTLPFYAPDDPLRLHHQVNALMLEHGLVPGSLVNLPVMTAQSWDFSPLDEELRALPPGTVFHAPFPYNRWTRTYLLRDQNGTPYTAGMFDDPQFVAQAEAYFAALAEYLHEQDRLDDALVYPYDETRWVGDEPIHAGPAGYERLAAWTQIARGAGFRVRASGVAPVPPGPTTLGWIESAQVADDAHVEVDVFDAAPDLFEEWVQDEGRSVSLYLNQYGDLIDMPAAIQRGLIWHAYGRGVRQIAGYEALEWVNAQYSLVDPWTQPDALYPQVGYGGGALIWPGPLPSLRLKLLREGIEDARLLDRYAQMTSPADAQALAACLTPGPLADQNPASDLWDTVHAALLTALTNGEPVNSDDLCLSTPTYTRQRVVLDMDETGRDLAVWDFEGAQGRMIRPWIGPDYALSIEFSGETAWAGYWLGESKNWRAWTALHIDVRSDSPYFTKLDVGLSDANRNYVLLRNGAIILGPHTQRTLTLPLVPPIDTAGDFDWSAVVYITLQVNTVTEQTDGFGVTRLFPLGPRTLVFDNFVLVR